MKKARKVALISSGTLFAICLIAYFVIACCGQSKGVFTASITSHSYDASTKTLSVNVDYQNGLNDAVYLVANAFDFGNAYREHVNLVDDGQVLLVDLAHPPIVVLEQTGKMYSEAVAAFGLSGSVAIAPHDVFHATYKFHFPFELDSNFSTQPKIDAPHGTRTLQWRVGWGRGMDIRTFLEQEHRRNPLPPQSDPWRYEVLNNDLIREQWQNISFASPYTIDFGPSSTEATPSKIK